MDLQQKIFLRASVKGLFASCIETPCGRRFWSFHLNTDDTIYCRRFDTYRPRKAIVNHIPEQRALWFLDAYDQERYDEILFTGDTSP